MIAPKETRYGNLRLRSRTEARWALFFDAAGIRFRYEDEGFDLDVGGYLPDFWLPEIGAYFEVKGVEPSPKERAKCAELAMKTESQVILAIGAPAEEFHLLWFDRDGEFPDRFALAKDRIADFGFWLVNDEGAGIRIGPDRTLVGRPCGPMFSGALEQAYAAAAGARFEHGEGRARHPVIPEIDPARLWEEAA